MKTKKDFFLVKITSLIKINEKKQFDMFLSVLTA